MHSVCCLQDVPPKTCILLGSSAAFSVFLFRFYKVFFLVSRQLSSQLISAIQSNDTPTNAIPPHVTHACIDKPSFKGVSAKVSTIPIAIVINAKTLCNPIMIFILNPLSVSRSRTIRHLLFQITCPAKMSLEKSRFLEHQVFRFPKYPLPFRNILPAIPL